MKVDLNELKDEFIHNLNLDYDLKKKNWFNIGGKTKVFFKANELKDLVELARLKYKDISKQKSDPNLLEPNSKKVMLRKKMIKQKTVLLTKSLKKKNLLKKNLLKKNK